MSKLIATDKEKLITYSEMFFSPQGEGMYTGEPTVWLRFFLCNLSCDGFGQNDPTDPSTYELPYKDFNLDGIARLEDLPVFEKGCDSSYSWAKRYRHLAHKKTARQIAGDLVKLMKNEHNLEGKFLHPKSGRPNHLAFTGGEPMMHQDAIVDIVESLGANRPNYITIETNGTQPLTGLFKDSVNDWGGEECYHPEILASISPKLFHVSGEDPKRAIKPEVIADYIDFFVNHQLKVVMNNDPRAWDQLDALIKTLKTDFEVWPNVFIMPVGATDKGQEESGAAVATMAMERGFAVSGRLHIQWFGNQIGT